MCEAATYTRVDRPDAACLVVTGEIDLGNIGGFASALAQLIDDARSPAVLDLRGVTFFGSTAIGALVTANHAAERRNVDLAVEPSPIVRRVLEITNLGQAFSAR